jgi:peptidoglycan/LPS O-acetylase OafA/YrhL
MGTLSKSSINWAKTARRHVRGREKPGIGVNPCSCVLEKLDCARLGQGLSVSHKNNFNLLRLLAATQVVFMHSYAHLHLPTWLWLMTVLGQLPGVACFFVISGFLVSDSCLRSSTGSFFFKRALRIYPGLVVNIVVIEVLMSLTGGISASGWASYLAYFQIYVATASDWMARWFAHVNYVESSFFPDYPSGVLWTLTVEISFYLMLPVLLAIVRAAKPIGVALLVAQMLVSFSLAHGSDDTFYVSHPLFDVTIAPYFWVFSFGILARIYWDKISWMFEQKLLLWLPMYAVVASAAVIFFAAHATLDYKIQPQWWEFVRVAVMAGVVLSAAFSFPSLTAHIGIDRNDYSYGIYLYHMLVVSTFIGLGIIGRWWLWPVIYAGAFALAAASWFLIEQPALGMKKWFAIAHQPGGTISEAA